MAIKHPSIFLNFLLLSSSLFVCLVCSSNEANAYEGKKETQHHHRVLLTSLLPATVCPTSVYATKGGVNVNNKPWLKIVDRHGPCSQLGREEAKTLTQILLQDQSRVDSLQSRILFNSSSSSSSGRLHHHEIQIEESSTALLPAHSGLSLGTGNYIVSVGFGTPKRQLSVVFDTGSDINWIQCEPCAKYCYKQQDPTFDPSQSSSYSNITCNATECSQLKSATGISPGCSSSSTCIYGIQYVDQSYSVGYFGRETLTLTPTDVFPNFLFGCGQNNRGLFGTTAGLLGLGRNKLSLVSQTINKYGGVFSYCLPSTSTTGYLKFGSSNDGRGRGRGRGRDGNNVKFTPLLIDSRGPSFYFIDLIAISVGGRKLEVSASVFATSGTVIDSGTVITRLPPSAYDALRSSFRKLMSNYPLTQALSILDTCYDLRGYDTVTIPKIALYFRGGVLGVMVDIDPTGILIVGTSTASQVCLAFAGNSDASDVAILGNRQQQKLEVIYDLTKGRLGFGTGGCS